MRILTWSLLLLASCEVEGEAGAELPVDAAPPTYVRTLVVGGIVAGSSFSARVENVPAGLTMTLVGSSDVYGAGWCPAAIAPACTDLAQPWRALDTATANANGVVTFTVNAPARMPPLVELMAYGRAGRNNVYTNGVVVEPLDPQGDADSDGLRTQDEINLGTDPGRNDSDGGGTSDGAEEAAGTDPLNSRDDRPTACNGVLSDPGNGITGCWYTAPTVSMSCDDVCAGHGGFDAAATQHTGNAAGVYFWPSKSFGSNWESVECSSTDNFTNWGANGNPPDPFFTHPACFVNCACMN